MKKIISMILAVVMLASAWTCTASAKNIFKWGKSENEYDWSDYKAPDEITIFVEGINSEAILDAETGETVFPPDTGTIIKTVADAVPDLVKAYKSDDTEERTQPVIDAVLELFTPIACDEDGNPDDSTAYDYEWQTEDELKEIASRNEPTSRVRYCYDWRLDMQTIAKQLHSFIEYVMEATGVSGVRLIGFSMGTCAVMSFLRMYRNEYAGYVTGVVLLAGAYRGTSCCGEPFSGKIGLESDALVRFVDGSLGYSLGGILATGLLRGLNAAGIADEVVDYGNELIDRFSDAVYAGVFADTFGSMPGMWALIPEEDYEDAKAMFSKSMSEEFETKIDWYHDEVQKKDKRIIDGILQRDIRFGIIAKYGYSMAPCIEDINTMSDTVIDTRYESFGATCADTDTDLGEDYVQQIDNGHDCISADNMIDSSTCAYCDKTWFIKNSQHASDLDHVMTLSYYIMSGEEQPTVWDSEEYPQFLIVTADDELLPLTEENDSTAYEKDYSGDTVVNVFFRSLVKWFRCLIETVLEKITDMFTF